MSELILKEDALNCFRDWIDRYGYEHTADEDAAYQRIAELKGVESCDDAISRRAVIDLFPDDDLEYDTKGGYIAPHLARQMICELPFVQPTQSNASNALKTLDCIDRRAAIDALWKALYTYEDETERQFQESDELDVGDWIGHRIFVQNMNDIDRQTILNLPSAQPEHPKGHWLINSDGYYPYCSECRKEPPTGDRTDFCPNCGAMMLRGEQDG